LAAAGAGIPPVAAGQVPGSPRLASAAERNWTQEHIDKNMDLLISGPSSETSYG